MGGALLLGLISQQKKNSLSIPIPDIFGHDDVIIQSKTNEATKVKTGTVTIVGTETAPPEDPCKKARLDVDSQYAKLLYELRKYVPADDALGGFKKHGNIPGLTKPCGHYKKVRNYQRGLKNKLTKLRMNCPHMRRLRDREMDRLANREIKVPSGCIRESIKRGIGG